MAVSGKYGKLNTAKIGENEPVFILRAQEIDAFCQWSGPKKIPD